MTIHWETLNSKLSCWYCQWGDDSSGDTHCKSAKSPFYRFRPDDYGGNTPADKWLTLKQMTIGCEEFKYQGTDEETANLVEILKRMPDDSHMKSWCVREGKVIGDEIKSGFDSDTLLKPYATIVSEKTLRL